jgi:polyketide cyclase/dehydrase/lipid transport protein
VNIEISATIDRPPEVVFRFVGSDHVTNRPRCDTGMQLEQVTRGPLPVGTILRRNARAGHPIDGTMECIEFDPPNAIRSVINDAGVEILRRQSIEPDGGERTRLTISVDVPVAPEALHPMPVENSLHRIKELIESETPIESR